MNKFQTFVLENCIFSHKKSFLVLKASRLDVGKTEMECVRQKAEIRREHIHIQLWSKINIFIGVFFYNRARSARSCTQEGIAGLKRFFS